MLPRRSLVVGALLGGCCAVAAVTAVQPRAAQPAPGATVAARLGQRVRILETNARTTTVLGVAWSVSGDPLAGVAVQLRNVLSGLAAADTRTNAAGEFAFGGVDAGTYVVELLNEGGNVVAVGAPFTVGSGETVATFVRLGLPAAGLAVWLTSAAAAAVAAAAVIGVVAVDAPANPASADR